MTSHTIDTVSLILRTFVNEDTKAEINLYNITFSGLPLECPGPACVFPLSLFLSLFIPQNHFAFDKQRHMHNTAVLLKDKKPTFLGIRLH